MKNSKENDTKVTKDVLLHSIFQEIADENIENSNGTHIDNISPAPKTKLSKIREMQKKRQWILIVILMITIIYVLFYTDIGSTQNKKDQSESDLYTIPKANQIVQIKEEPELPDVSKEEPKKRIFIEVTDPNQPIEKSPLKEEGPKTEREKAKEALLMQMQ
jgi:type IV secretory pathway VirB10-like protein